MSGLLKYIVCVIVFVGVVALQSLSFKVANQTIHETLTASLFTTSSNMLTSEGLVKQTLVFPGVTTTAGIISWFEDTVLDALFVEPSCGDGVCTAPEEYPKVEMGDVESLKTWSGCLADCQQAATARVTVDFFDAAKLANCYDFIMKFSNKFDTIVGNRGTQLSVGQKQRLAIARAAIRKPQVLLLDEATSALDAENEALVSTALEELMVGRTTVVVAHRLCTIQNADEVICMKDGAVIESGGYAELIEKKGEFFRLVQKQMTEEKNK